MDEKTFFLILHDLEVIGMNKNLSGKQIPICMSTYLFALAEHDVITTEEFKEIANTVVKVYTEEEEDDE